LLNKPGGKDGNRKTTNCAKSILFTILYHKKRHPPAAKQLPSLPQLLKLSMQGLVVRGAGRTWDFHEIYPTKMGISMGISLKSNMASQNHLSKQRL
jgi:hypothetical protein